MEQQTPDAAIKSAHPLSRNPGAVAALLAMPLFFAMNLVLGRAAVAATSPWSLAFWRWLIAVLILLPFAWRALAANRDVLLAQWKRLFVLGLLGMVLCGGNVYVSLQHTTATNATLIYTTSTIMVVVIDAVLAGRMMPPGQIIGAVAGFIGIALITVHGDLWRLVELEFNIGDLGILVAALSWATYSLMLRREAMSKIGPVPAFTAIAICGLILLTPPMIWENLRGGHGPQGLLPWVSVLALALFASVLAFTLFQYCVRVAGASTTAVFLYLMPAYGIVMALAFLGEELHLYHAVGFVLILGGVILATRPAR